MAGSGSSQYARLNGRADVSLWGISDMELLGIVDDLADELGWTLTTDIRLQLGEDLDKGYRSGVGPRLSWMRRYGWLEGRGTGSQKNPKQWRLTPIGHALLDNPKLSKTIENALGKLNPAQRLVLTRELGELAQSGAGEVRSAMLREWRRQLRT